MIFVLFFLILLQSHLEILACNGKARQACEDAKWEFFLLGSYFISHLTWINLIFLLIKGTL